MHIIYCQRLGNINAARDKQGEKERSPGISFTHAIVAASRETSGFTAAVKLGHHLQVFAIKNKSLMSRDFHCTVPEGIS